MDVLIFNSGWMSLNVFLAFIPVVFGYLMLKEDNIFVRAAYFAVWFIFLPNSLYLLTDITHLFEDAAKISGYILIIDSLAYTALIAIGIYTFIISLNFFEKTVFPSKKLKKNNNVSIAVLNLFVGFGIVLGRIQRINSWEVLTNTKKVLVTSFATVKSLELLIMAVSFAVLCQFVYLVFSRRVLKTK